MRNSLLILLSVVFLFSCNKNKLPSGILPQEKMQAVMWDMMRADQFLTDYVFSKDSSVNHDTASIRLYQQVLSIHKLSKEEFKRSFDYYNSHPLLLREVMDSISAGKKNITPVTPVKPMMADTNRVFKGRKEHQVP